jgi:hypothetical protein
MNSNIQKVKNLLGKDVNIKNVRVLISQLPINK